MAQNEVKKILLCGMALDIGGAETHLVELACELARRGHAVTVASSGGVYVDTLTAHGVSHLTLPLHTKSLPSVLRACRGLWRFIRAEKPDIVHAHARIPAFLCGLLAVFLRFRFVTTVHGTYTTRPLFSALSNWGERTLAPSCDLKQYLIDSYGIPSDSVTVTVNGIDTERFSPTLAPADDLHLSGDHVIVHVSRLDPESVATARALLAAMTAVSDRFPDAELVIVGGGGAEAEIAREAEAVNAALGRTAVVLTGRRTDVGRILVRARAAVGVSRAALEAMACGRPVILSGSPAYGQGYGGLFTPALLEESRADNFCCRGKMPDTGRQLAADLIGVLSMDAAALAAMGEANRAVVKQYYSVARMADDAEAVYAALTPAIRPRHGRRGKNGHVVISGYYGYHNMGDDSLLAAMTAALKRENPDLTITVLSRHPRGTRRALGVCAVGRFHPISLLIALRRADLLISGGGSLLQNETSARSLLYYTWVIRAAKRLGCRVAVYASGIGPVHGDRYRRLVAQVLEKADSITLREGSSRDEVRRMGVKNPNLAVTADPVFGMADPDPEWIAYVMRREGIEPEKDYFAVSLRAWPSADGRFEAETETYCRTVAEKYGLIPLFFPLQPDRDEPISRRLAQKTGGRVIGGLTASELSGILAHTRFCVGMRLHALIYTARAGVPFIGLSYDPKIDALARTLNVTDTLPVENVTADRLLAMTDALMADRDAVAASIRSSADRLASLTAADASRVMSLLARG